MPKEKEKEASSFGSSFVSSEYICSMKTILLCGALSLIAQVGFGQATDTLGWDNFQNGTSIVYGCPLGGFAFGNNGYRDKAKAQTYRHDKSFVLNGVLMLFGEVNFESQDSSSVVRVNLYNNYGEGITSSGYTDSIAPDSVLAFVDIPVYEIMDDGSFTYADFSDSILAIFNKFSVGIDFTQLSEGDTVGLLSTTDGDAGESGSAWELTANGTWFTVEESAYSWDLDVDLAIFPVIDEDHIAGIENHEELILDLYPNPASEQVFLKFPFMDHWRIEAFDFLGQKVFSKDCYSDQLKLNISDLSNSTYILKVENERFTGARLLVVN